MPAWCCKQLQFFLVIEEVKTGHRNANFTMKHEFPNLKFLLPGEELSQILSAGESGVLWFWRSPKPEQQPTAYESDVCLPNFKVFLSKSYVTLVVNCIV